MSEWKEYKLGDLVRLKIIDKPLDGNHGGIHPTSKDYVDKGIPFVMASDVNDGKVDLKNCKFITFAHSQKLKKGFAKEGDVLLTHKASLGRTAIVPKLETGYMLLTPQVTYYRVLDNTELNNVYLKYYFDSPEFQNTLQTWGGSGSTRAYIGITEQLNLPVRIPEISTQRAIAEILSSLDDKIELNNQTNANLEALAQAIFKQWFIDFEFPDENGNPYKSSGGKMVESEIGEIPHAWAIEQLGNVAKATSGGTPSRQKLEYYDDGKILWVKSKELNNSMIFNTEEKINDVGLKNSSAKLLPAYSVLIAMYGATVGQFGLITEEATCNQAICAILPSKTIPYSFWYMFFQNYRKLFANLAVGSAQQNISQDLIKRIKLALPTPRILQKFHLLIDGALKAIEHNCRENALLQSLRDQLLPSLISGQLEILAGK